MEKIMKYGILTLVVLLSITACSIKSPEEMKQQNIKVANESCASGLSALVYSKYFVEERLRSSSAVDFPFSDYTSNYLGDCTHNVSSYVDAKNGFGTVVRQYYTAKVQYNKTKDEWYLLSLDMQLYNTP